MSLLKHFRLFVLLEKAFFGKRWKRNLFQQHETHKTAKRLTILPKTFL